MTSDFAQDNALLITGGTMTGVLTMNANIVSKTITNPVSVLTPGTTVSLDPTLSDTFTDSPTQNQTINAASAPVGQYITIIFTSDNGSRVITFGTNFKSTGTLNLGAVAGKIFVVSFISDGTNFNEVSRTTAM